MASKERGATWNDAETEALIEILAEDAVQEHKFLNVVGAAIFVCVSPALRAAVSSELSRESYPGLRSKIWPIML